MNCILLGNTLKLSDYEVGVKKSLWFMPKKVRKTTAIEQVFFIYIRAIASTYYPSHKPKYRYGRAEILSFLMKR